MDMSSGNSSDTSVALCSSSSSSCSEQRQLRTSKEETACALGPDVPDRRKHSGEYESEVSSSGGCSAHRASSTPSSGASLFQQHFLQTNGNVSGSPVMVQHGGFSPGSFSAQTDQMSINSAATPMQAFAAAANNIGLFCAPPGASVPQFPSSVPSGAFSLVNYGHRPPMVQQLAAVQQQRQMNSSGNPVRKNGSSATIHSSASTSSTSSSSINRSQRCGVCRGCQCKPCGQCTYCQDSPQFGGPGVKKQSCIERRCLRVLENRLQRDAPTFKARVGCNACEDCRSPDCQICLVCLDKRFFNGRYMQTTHPCVAQCGALCAKKRCNNATSLELPCSPLDRPSLKRPSSDSSANQTQQQPLHYHHLPQHQQQQMAKRQLIQPSVSNSASINSNIARILNAAQHGGGEGKAEKYGGAGGRAFGRSSGGNSTTNSPMSENGAVSSADTSPSQQQQMLMGARPLWPSAQQCVTVAAHQSPAPVLVPLGVPYAAAAASFDQQMAASLAAAAAVGFPSAVQQNQHNFHSSAVYNNNNNYPHKFLGYPKYEYFEESAVAAIGGGIMAEGMPTEHQLHQNHQQSPGVRPSGGGNVPGSVGGGSGADNANNNNNNTNPFVPPSYSAERKVVLQPL
uniref:CXXC-type domain-containing protein n=1 Tax=Globodera rostochiensis TaxID=31243 RepID=A0A914HAT9_GLORO